MALEDRVRGALPELGLEHGRQREPAAGPAAPDAVLGRSVAPRSRAASGPDAIDQDGDAAELEAEQALDGAADGVAHLRR